MSTSTLSPTDFEEAFEGMLADRAVMVRPVINRSTVSELAERKRILPQGLTPLPGPFRWTVAPFMREIADCFSESSPVERVAFMKGAQITATVSVLENILLYIVDSAPGPTLYVSSDKEMAQTSVELRVDRMLESAGLAGRIFSQSEKAHNKKTGDTKLKKEFAGGFLLAVGPNVAAKLRQFSIRYLLLDEIEAYPQSAKDEGDPVGLAVRRTDAFESMRKILFISTPLIEQTSRIKPLYLAGDQRRWFVPCKHCGEMQPLEWRNADGVHRLKYSTDEDGRLIPDSVHYECSACGGHWKNADKAWFLGRGEWRATAKPLKWNYRSYHLSALYSPLEMRSWESIVEEWLDAKDNPLKLKVFTNTVLGETWVERGEAPQHERIMLRNREPYQAGTLPASAKPLLVTCGADVQADRIEAEVVAWGRDKESWSIEYCVFPGPTLNVDSEAWRQFEAFLTAAHAGLLINCALVDSHFNTPAVNAFCARFGSDSLLPVEGDTRVGKYQRLFLKREAVGFPGLKRIDLYTSPLKMELYNYLRLGSPDHGKPFPPGYPHFPENYSERYFRQLTAEELVRTRTRTGAFKMEWRQRGGRANEAMDCRIYAMGALAFYVDRVREVDFQSEELSWSDFWSWCEAQRQRAAAER